MIEKAREDIILPAIKHPVRMAPPEAPEERPVTTHLHGSAIVENPIHGKTGWRGDQPVVFNSVWPTKETAKVGWYSLEEYRGLRPKLPLEKTGKMIVVTRQDRRARVEEKRTLNRLK